MSSLSRQNVKTIACAAAVFVAAGLLYFLTAARDLVVGLFVLGAVCLDYLRAMPERVLARLFRTKRKHAESISTGSTRLALAKR
jgi:hypothetical protein